MKRTLSTRPALLPALAALVLLIAMPQEASAGARSGITVCIQIIVPSLLPFFVLSGLLSALGAPQSIARAAAPLLQRLGISPYAAAPLILGLVGGYPVGAAAVGDLVRSGALSEEDGNILLPFCNNTGPAFIIGAAGSAIFGSGSYGLLLYCCHVAAALSLALLLPHRIARAQSAIPRHTAPVPFSQALTRSITSAVGAAANICGYVIFFSVLTALLRAAGVISGLSAFLSLRAGMELQAANALTVGILELGSGIGTMQGLAPTPGNLSLASFLLGFGGLSVHCQTLSVLDGTKIKCARHFIGRILAGTISAFLTYLLSLLLKI